MELEKIVRHISGYLAGIGEIREELWHVRDAGPCCNK